MEKNKDVPLNQDTPKRLTGHEFYRSLGFVPSNRKVGQSFVMFTDKPKPQAPEPPKEE